jgi:hypothetical protein
VAYQWPTKDPAETIDYSIDWTGRLATAETISGSSWSAPGLTVVSTSYLSAISTVWVSGGSAGTTYDLVNTITTSGGRTLRQTVAMPCATR